MEGAMDQELWQLSLQAAERCLERAERCIGHAGFGMPGNVERPMRLEDYSVCLHCLAVELYNRAAKERLQVGRSVRGGSS
jgi:hypothetical protein